MAQAGEFRKRGKAQRIGLRMDQQSLAMQTGKHSMW